MVCCIHGAVYVPDGNQHARTTRDKILVRE
jgi:hypothetical protein